MNLSLSSTPMDGYQNLTSWGPRDGLGGGRAPNRTDSYTHHLAMKNVVECIV